MSHDAGLLPVGATACEDADVDLAPAVTLAPTVGARLKAERERLGMSIGDVAQRLKYAPRQIEAVEADDFKTLPGLPFVRGFVRGYAKLLGMDASALVPLLERAAEQDGGPITVQLQSVSSTRARFPASQSSYTSALPWLLAILLVIAGIGGYSIYHWQAPADLLPVPAAREPTQTQQVPAPVTGANSQNPTAVSPAESPNVTPLPLVIADPQAGIARSGTLQSPALAAEPVRQSAAAETPAVTATGRQGKLRLVFGGESWTEIREAGGRVIFSRNNLGGTEQWAEGQAPFDLVVGNARDVKLFYRGAEIDLSPYIKVSVARLQLK